MSQDSLTLPTTGTLSGLSLAQFINLALANLASMASGATDPSTLSGGVLPYSLWMDTSASPAVIRQRNAANTGWTAPSTAPATLGNHAVRFDQVASVVGTARGIKASLTTAGTSLTMLGAEVVAKTALGGLAYVNANWSDTLNLATTGAGGMDTGSAPTNGFVAIFRIYNPSTNTWKLVGYNTTTTAATEVYGGANMPAGYTASVLIGVWPTNGSGQLVPGYLQDRRFTYVTGITVLNTTTAQVSYASLNIASAVPKNARTLSAQLNANGQGGSTNTSIVVASDANGAGLQWAVGSGANASGNAKDLPILTVQTIYYQETSAITPMINTFIKVTDYTF